MREEFSRAAKLIGEEGLQKLADSSVLVLGIGGVGSYVTEALARGGVGRVDVLDDDFVQPTNINRQIIALRSTVGKRKTDVVRERLTDINPEIKCETFHMRFGSHSAKPDFGNYDYVVDAVDTVEAKVCAAVRAKEAGTAIISVLGTGNKLNPEAFRIADINETEICPLARAVRRELRKTSVEKLTVVYSREEPVKTGMRTPASISFVPPVAGLLAASYVIRDMLDMVTR